MVDLLERKKKKNIHSSVAMIQIEYISIDRAQTKCNFDLKYRSILKQIGFFADCWLYYIFYEQFQTLNFFFNFDSITYIIAMELCKECFRIFNPLKWHRLTLKMEYDDM